MNISMASDTLLKESSDGTEYFVFSPSTLLDIYHNVILSCTETDIHRLKGIFLKTTKPSYGGFFYNEIKDESGDQCIALKTPAIYHHQLHNNQLIELFGFKTSKLNKRGNFDNTFNIVEMITSSDHTRLMKESEKLKILSEKSQMGIKDMDGLIRSKIFRNQPVIIRVIVGRTGTIEEDIRKAIGFLPPLYNIDYRKTTLDSPPQIITALVELDKKGADIICISRGGGNLEIFNDNELCRKIVSLNAIIGSAIGHASDENLFDLVADKKFPTPTAFGNYLKLMHEKAIAEIENNKNEINKNSANTHQGEIKELKESILDLQTKNFAANNLLHENYATLKNYETKLKLTTRNNKILFITTIILSILLAILNFT